MDDQSVKHGRVPIVDVESAADRHIDAERPDPEPTSGEPQSLDNQAVQPQAADSDAPSTIAGKDSGGSCGPDEQSDDDDSLILDVKPDARHMTARFEDIVRGETKASPPPGVSENVESAFKVFADQITSELLNIALQGKTEHARLRAIKMCLDIANINGKSNPAIIRADEQISHFLNAVEEKPLQNEDEVPVGPNVVKFPN